jgi:hypothetical protein
MASWFETHGVAALPHHEGLRPHPEERPLGRVSKDEPTTARRQMLYAGAGHSIIDRVLVAAS